MAVEKRVFQPERKSTISLLGVGHMAVKYPMSGGTPKPETMEHLKPLVKGGRWDEVTDYLKKLRLEERQEFHALHHFLIRKISSVGRAWEKMPSAYYLEAMCRVLSHMPVEMLSGRGTETSTSQ